MDQKLELEFYSVKRTGQVVIRVRLAGEILHVDRINLLRATERARFVNSLSRIKPGCDRDVLMRELLKFADVIPTKYLSRWHHITLGTDQK